MGQNFNEDGGSSIDLVIDTRHHDQYFNQGIPNADSFVNIGEKDERNGPKETHKVKVTSPLDSSNISNDQQDDSNTLQNIKNKEYDPRQKFLTINKTVDNNPPISPSKGKA